MTALVAPVKVFHAVALFFTAVTAELLFQIVAMAVGDATIAAIAVWDDTTALSAVALPITAVIAV